MCRATLSLGASFGLSVLIWQDILGIHLFWIVLALAIILLLAAGSDYNLLLIVRSFMTPSIARLLGRWFWWPLRVRPRPASQMLRPYGTRQSVRQLLLWEDEDPATTSKVPPRTQP